MINNIATAIETKILGLVVDDTLSSTKGICNANKDFKSHDEYEAKGLVSGDLMTLYSLYIYALLLFVIDNKNLFENNSFIP
jgi:hypothetical protein